MHSGELNIVLRNIRDSESQAIYERGNPTASSDGTFEFENLPVQVQDFG